MKFNIYIIMGGENVLKKIVKFISSIMGIAVGYIIGKVLITLGIKQGIKLFIATGRHYLELELLGINNQFTFDGYLTLNGGYCFDHKGVIYSNPINKEDVKRVVEYTTKHNLACSFVESDSLYVN